MSTKISICIDSRGIVRRNEDDGKILIGEIKEHPSDIGNPKIKKQTIVSSLRGLVVANRRKRKNHAVPCFHLLEHC